MNKEQLRDGANEVRAVANKICAALEKCNKIELAIANGHDNDQQTIEDEDRLIAAYKAVFGEILDYSRLLVERSDRLQKIARLSSDAANKAKPETIVQNSLVGVEKRRGNN